MDKIYMQICLTYSLSLSPRLSAVPPGAWMPPQRAHPHSKFQPCHACRADRPNVLTGRSGRIRCWWSRPMLKKTLRSPRSLCSCMRVGLSRRRARRAWTRASKKPRRQMRAWSSPGTWKHRRLNCCSSRLQRGRRRSRLVRHHRLQKKRG